MPIALTLALAGCVPTGLPSGPPEYFARIIQAGTMEPRAVAECDAMYEGLSTGSDAARLLAAVNSTVGDIRKLEGDPGVVDDYDDGLPTRADAYMAICIVDTSNNEKMRPVAGIAMWVGTDETVVNGPGGGSGVIAAWRPVSD